MELFFSVLAGITAFSPHISDEDVIFSPLLVHRIVQDGQNPSNGSVADKTNDYDIGELATSSLMGESGTQSYKYKQVQVTSRFIMNLTFETGGGKKSKPGYCISNHGRLVMQFPSSSSVPFLSHTCCNTQTDMT